MKANNLFRLQKKVGDCWDLQVPSRTEQWFQIIWPFCNMLSWQSLTKNCYFGHEGWSRVIWTNCTCACAQNNKIIFNGDSKSDNIQWLYTIFYPQDQMSPEVKRSYASWRTGLRWQLLRVTELTGLIQKSSWAAEYSWKIKKTWNS